MKKTRLAIFLIAGWSLFGAACSSDSNSPAAAASIGTPAEGELPSMVVYKDKNCGCCKDWVSYIEDAGYPVTAIDHENLGEIKANHGLTDPALSSCHTAIVDGYVIEGHVPLSDIERLLAERPPVLGLTAPGMPMMSPGMGSEIPEGYDVLAFDENNNTRIYSSY